MPQEIAPKLSETLDRKAAARCTRSGQRNAGGTSYSAKKGPDDHERIRQATEKEGRSAPDVVAIVKKLNWTSHIWHVLLRQRNL
jgi:hypothetical protein